MDNNCKRDYRPARERQCDKPCAVNGNIILPNEHQRETAFESNPSEHLNYDRLLKSRTGQSRDEIDPRRGGIKQSYPMSWPSSDVEWVVDQWSSCQLVPGSDTCGRNSGTQYRNVTCETKDRQGRVSPSRCELEEPMPVTSQSCELLCRQDCVVSTYSDWSGCDNTCLVSNQTRTRKVIVPPRHRGSHCPELSEMTVCENCSHSYMYKLSDWLPCSPIVATYMKDIKSHSLIGYQIRDISCLQIKGIMTSLSFCAHKFPHTVLSKHRACVTAQDCKVSDWSAMHPFNTSCIEYDGHIIHDYTDASRDGAPCPLNLVEYIQLNKEDNSLLRPCTRGKWIMSSWSLCQSVSGYNHCGTGIRTRRALCVEADDEGTERPVDDNHCPVPKPAVAQSCTLECSWDCSVSQWSAWSTCHESKCERSDLKKRQVETQTGMRFRTRQMLTIPGPGGGLCPHLSETKMCEPQLCYTWNITLGPCEPTARGGCGDGTQLKKATCQNRAGEKVRERFCHESLHSEQNWANCYIPCPEDCVLSEWGQWTVCPDPCLVPDSMKSRQRNILAYHGPGRRSRQCPSTNSLVQTELCPVIQDCMTYQWDVSAWGHCYLNPDNPNMQCGPGIQNRTVECMTSRGVRSPTKCEDSVKPKTLQSCTVDCPIDCHVTEWSRWSTCGIECLPVQARHVFPTQTRRRFLLQYPQNGGLSCPHILKEDQLCSSLPVCLTYYWDITEWSDCVLPPVVPLCGQGLKARNITCHQNDEKGTKEVSITACLEKLGLMPDLTEVCYIPCDSECHFSPWTPWTLCGPECQKTRFRIRRLMDESKNNPSCHDTELYPRDQHQECVCDSIPPSIIGEWSDCIIQSKQQEESVFASMSLKSISTRHRRTNATGVSGLGSQIYCGEGKRFKALSCHTASHNMFDAPVCAGEDYQEENCTVLCPVDCQITSWTTWSFCSSNCGSGIQRRERQIMTLPKNGGRRCPFIYGQKETQTRVCHTDCKHNAWRMDDWDSCIPRESRSCGEGTQRRVVRCASLSLEGTEVMAVADSFCSSSDKPSTIKLCSLPCPGECVLSEWSDWTACSQPCTGKQTQSRTRSVLRMPASYSVSQTCLAENEERLCERWKNCLEYSWEFSDWTSCLVNYGESECGVGHKERFAFCKSENGGIVESYLCEDLFGHVTEPMAVSCEIPCDNDCLMSDWSDWTACSTTCGLGFTRRRRTVLQNPIANGRKCPEYLDQSKPCFQKGCYRWLVSDWSQCIVQKGVCGSGLQERNISCLNDEGRPVVTSRCDNIPEVLVMRTSRQCRVPCPGECKLSEWSTWSDCYISCEDFEQGFTTGVQARSRAILAYPSAGNVPCDGSLWEDKACVVDKCSKFQWVTADWNKLTSTRQVFCELNDDLRVIGGCDDKHKPGSILTCLNPICLHPAECENFNICSCPPGEGFQLHSINSTALTCIMNSTGEVDQTASGLEIANSPNIWMYAVIAIGTLFVIAVTAALYNMCELFRTGPRPRRKGQSGREDSASAVVDNVVQGSRQWVQDMENQRSVNDHKNHNYIESDVGCLIVETAILSSSCQDLHHSVAPSLSHDLLDSPGVDTAICTPISSTLTNMATSATTISTIVTPTDPGKTSSRPEVVTSQVGGIIYNHSEPEPKLSHKHNRRYKRVHRLLPSNLIKCLTCNDNASTSMLDDQHGNVNASKVSLYQDLSVPLTLAPSTPNIEMCWVDVNTSNSSRFHNHNCMLTNSREFRPTNLDIPKYDKILDDLNMREEEISISLIDEIDDKMKRTSPAMHTVLPISSRTGDDTKRLPNPSSKARSYEFLTACSNMEHVNRGDGSAQCLYSACHKDTTLRNDTSSSETKLQSLHKHPPINFKSLTTKEHILPARNSLHRPTNTPLTSTIRGGISPTLDQPRNVNLTNLHVVRGLPLQDASGTELSDARLFGTSPSHARDPSPVSHPVDVLTCSMCSHSFSKWTQNIHQNPKLTIDVPSPMSYSSLSSYTLPRHNESPDTSYHQSKFFTTKSAASPASKGKIVDNKGGESRVLGTSPKISSSASLPENLVNRTIPFRNVPPLLQKISQDSGHSTIPRSQTASLEDNGPDLPLDVMVRSGKRSRLSPLHVQTSVESGDGYSAYGVCDSCRRDIRRSGVSSSLMGSSVSTSQASNICGMETSV